ncbi:MAG: Tol biopolymer transport system component [Myxococcota bacterium]|jgi:Tol biopolymer transport system component
MGTRLAYIGGDRQLYVLSRTGLRQVTWSSSMAMGLWGGSAGSDGRTWPSWSPDGRWLASFHIDGGEDDVTTCRVSVVEVDGVQEEVLAEIEGALPIYIQWHSDGQRLAVLVQAEDELQLWTCTLHRIGEKLAVEQGVPLFFSWAPNNHYIAVHAGEPRRRGSGRLMLRNLTPTGEDGVFDELPGSFCTPVFFNDRLLYVTGRGLLSHVCVSLPDGSSPQVIASMEGLLAVIPSPSGDRIAIASAPRGEGSPYRGIWVVDVDGGPVTQILSGECQAYFWLPDGQQMVYAQVDREANCLQWLLLTLATGESVSLGAFWPSRDQMFYLHFFEQYYESHPLISPDGRTLIYAGHPGPDELGDRSSRLWRVDLQDPGSPPVAFATGTFAVFSPGAPPAG